MHHNQGPYGSPGPYNYGSGYPQPYEQSVHQQTYEYSSHQPMHAHASLTYMPPTFAPIVRAPPAFTPSLPPPYPPPPPLPHPPLSHPPPSYPPPSYPPPIHGNPMPTYGPNHYQPAYTPSHYASGPQRAYEFTYSSTVHHYNPFPPQPTSGYNGPTQYGSGSSAANTSRNNQLPGLSQTSRPNTPHHPQAQQSPEVANPTSQNGSPRSAISPSHWPIVSEPQTCIPPEAFVAPHEETFLLMIAQDQEDIPRLPSNRNRIWHAVCGRMHAPEECRGPLTKGTLEGCALCGRAEHITDDCGYWLLLPQNKRTSLKRYLYLFSRQGLPPLASRRDFTAQKMEGLRPPLCPITATHYEHKQNQLDRQAGQYRPYHARFNYDALADTHVELARLPEEDPCLGKWKTSGPPPNRLADWVKSDFLGREHAQAYDPSWTLFANKHVRSHGKRVVEFPKWVTHVESLIEPDPHEVCKNAAKHRRDQSPPQQSSTPVHKKMKLTPTCLQEDEEGELPYDTPEKAPNTGDNPKDTAKDHSEAKEDPHVAEWEEIYLREERNTDSLAKLSPGEARKIENEHERDELQPPQSPFLAPHKRKLSMTYSDFKKHEENGDQQEGRPEKLLKVEDIVVDASEIDPTGLPPDVNDLEHANHDDQRNFTTTELEFWCPDPPECSSDEETTGHDFDYDPASPDWSGPEQDTGSGGDYDPGSPDWENDQ